MIETIIINWLKFCSWILQIWPGDKRYIIKFHAWILQNILRYRSKTIRSNLEMIQPQLTPIQVQKITDQYYSNIVRYLLEIIESIGLDDAQLKAKILTSNILQWHEISSLGTSIIMASHYGNWEVNLTALPLLVPHKVIAFYKPIKNKMVERIMKKLRSKHGLILFPIDQTARIMNENKDQKVWYIFVSDQGPLNMNGVYWNQFLGLDTPWLTGAEKLAKKYNYPVFYLHQKVLKGDPYYDLNISLISNDPRTTQEGQIIEKYTQLLAQEIAEDYSSWLWSHKRWKRANQKKASPTN